MSVKAILTNRELKNKVTGIDLYVSDFQEIPHRIKNTYLYHVIVVTNLFYYKSREHRESDVVQFMVSKSFEEFQELYEKLYKRFPSVNFPALPAKSFLSSNTTDKLKCMDDVLKLVATTQKLCCSPMLIAFLKGEIKASVDMKEKSPKTIEEDIVPSKEEEQHSAPPEFEDVDLFEKPNAADVKDDIFNDEPIDNVASSKSIFDDDYSQTKEAEVADDDLFSQQSPMKSSFEKKYDFEDDVDLLDVSDDLDDLLSLSKTSEKQSSIKVQKPKPAIRPKPNQGENGLLSQLNDEREDMFQQARRQSVKKERSDSSNISDIFDKKKSSLFDQDDDDGLFSSSIPKNDVDNMGQDDIASYILQQESNNDAALDL